MKYFPVKQNLFKWGVIEDALCMFCGDGIESIQHLIVSCVYSRKVIEGLAHALGLQVPYTDLISWSATVQTDIWKRKALACIFKVCYYRIWQQRNKTRLQSRVMRPDLLVAYILKIACLRIRVIHHGSIGSLNPSWFSSIVNDGNMLCLCN
ncbi:hypothetical protein RND81_01G079800 [Saponaria officinalis]|uniref:Reverse transcriptase zinc-binding domain-containing protein n=1 Tax=Saponaria officinalis TaxID=3572 RepID=A0AAW1NDL5_SAPOF